MRRRAVIIAGVLVVVGIGAVAARRASIDLLRGRVVGALGPGAVIGSLDVGLRRLTVNELELPGGQGWPAEHAVRAEQVAIVPSLLSLFSRQIRIASVDVVAPYVSMLRTRGGRLRIAPTLLEHEPTRAGAPAKTHSAPGGSGAASSNSSSRSGRRSVVLGRLVVSDGEVALYDASVATPPWRIRLIGLDATVESIVAPGLDGRLPLDVSATIDGPARDGTVALSGWVVPGTKDLDLTARLRGVDLLAFQPYVMRSSKARLSRGQFDLDLHATVKDGHLSAPGHLVLADVAFAPGGRGSDEVMGVPRDLLLAALETQGGRIALDFYLQGNVDDPRFSLNEAVAVQIAAGLIERLGGLSIPGLVEGVSGLGGGTLEGTGKVGKSEGEALKGLLRGR